MGHLRRTIFRAFPQVCVVALALAAATILSGCGSSSAPKGEPALDAQRAQTKALEDRRARLEGQMHALPEQTAEQIAFKGKISRLLELAKIESLRKNPLDGTIPEAAAGRITAALDEAEKELKTK